MDKPDSEEWLSTLHRTPQADLYAYISDEDGRLLTVLRSLADDIHGSMAAWHSLGLADTVGRLFRNLESYLAGVSGKADGWLMRQIKDFFSESEPGIPDEVVSGIEAAHRAATTYQQRMKALSEGHSAALEAYKSWISALSRITATGNPGNVRAYIIRRSAETISAQEQLGAAACLQLENIRMMAADIREVTLISGSLAMNWHTTAKMQEQRYRSGISRLREYLGKEHR